MSSRDSYRPDIDGLRALAVALVVACHAGFATFKGGFIGVDVFFVISGFVVTRSIESAQIAGDFRFRDFFIKRAKRLTPALFAMMAATFTFSVLFLIPDDAMEVAKNIAFAAGLSANIYLSKKTGYFAPDADQQPLLHTWSLSVEEQFYLAFPVVMFVIRRASWRTKVSVLIAIGAVSLAWAEIAVAKAQPGAYFFSQYRAYEFALGAIVALIPTPRIRPQYREALVAASLVSLVAAGVLITDQPWPGLWALVPTSLAAVAVLLGDGTRVAHATLSNRITLWFGKRSYGIYLWHWPVMFAFRRFGFNTSADLLTAAAVSVCVAAVSYRFIEQPLRHARVPLGRAALAYIAAPIALSAATVALGRNTSNFLFLYPTQFQQTYAASTDKDWMTGRGADCWDKVGVTAASKCSVGSAGGRKAVLWGDSHAYHFLYFFREMGREFNISVHDMARPLCPPLADPPIGARRNMDVPCQEHDKLVMSYLLNQAEVSIVFMSATWSAYVNDSASGRSERGFSAGQLNNELYLTASALIAAGKQVVVLDDVPPIPANLVNCPLYNRLRWAPEVRDCSFSRDVASSVEQIHRSVVNDLKRRLPAVQIIHTYGAACDGSRCSTFAGATPLYRNNDLTHLNLTGGASYYKLYRRKHPGELEQILGKPV